MNTKELQHHIAYIKMSETIGNLSYCVRKKVGSVMVKDNNIISTGYNGTPSGTDNVCEDINGETNWFTLHSEANAISKIAKSTLSSEGSILYLTLSPCKDCSKLILQAGIKEIYYLVEHSCKAGLEFLEEQGIKCFNIKRFTEEKFEESGKNSGEYALNIYEEYKCTRFGNNHFVHSSTMELVRTISIDKLPTFLPSRFKLNSDELIPVMSIDEVIESVDESKTLGDDKRPNVIYIHNVLPLSLDDELKVTFNVGITNNEEGLVHENQLLLVEIDNINNEKNVYFKNDDPFFDEVKTYIINWFKKQYNLKYDITSLCIDDETKEYYLKINVNKKVQAAGVYGKIGSEIIDEIKEPESIIYIPELPNSLVKELQDSTNKFKFVTFKIEDLKDDSYGTEYLFHSYKSSYLKNENEFESKKYTLEEDYEYKFNKIIVNWFNKNSSNDTYGNWKLDAKYKEDKFYLIYNNVKQVTIKEPEQVYLPSTFPLPLMLELMQQFNDNLLFILDDGNIVHDKNLDFFMKQSDRYYFRLLNEYTGVNMWIHDWFKNNKCLDWELIDDRKTNSNKIYLKYKPTNNEKEIIQQNRNNIFLPNNFPESLINHLNSQFTYTFIKINIDKNYPNWHKDTLFLYGTDNKYRFKNIKEFQSINESIKKYFNLLNNKIDNWFYIEIDENNIYLENIISNPISIQSPSYLIPDGLGRWKVNPYYVFPEPNNTFNFNDLLRSYSISAKEMTFNNGQLQYKPISFYKYGDSNLITHNHNYEKLLVKEVVCIPKYVFPLSYFYNNLKHVFGDEIKITEWELNNFIDKNIIQGDYIHYIFKLDTDLKKQIFNYIVELVRQENDFFIQKIDDKTLKIRK